jgi:hypothetical protein
MPPGDVTEISGEERATIAAWLESGTLVSKAIRPTTGDEVLAK